MAAKKLDKDYFYGPLKVPQMTDAAVERNLNVFIAMYEEQFMRLLLGDTLYDEYVAGLAVSSPDAKWTDLENQIYQVTGDAPNQVKLSPAANYVYWYYMRDQVTTTTASGEKLMDTENASNIGSAPKLKLMWNNMVTKNRNIVSWLKARPGVYTTYLEPVWDGSTPEAIRLYKDRYNILRTAIPFF